MFVTWIRTLDHASEDSKSGIMTTSGENVKCLHLVDVRVTAIGSVRRASARQFAYFKKNQS